MNTKYLIKYNKEIYHKIKDYLDIEGVEWGNISIPMKVIRNNLIDVYIDGKLYGLYDISINRFVIYRNYFISKN